MKMMMSHPSRDVWIEILLIMTAHFWPWSHIPRGMCGLKSLNQQLIALAQGSHPSRDVWIEIHGRELPFQFAMESHPSRDVWIEMILLITSRSDGLVTSLAGCVD